MKVPRVDCYALYRRLDQVRHEQGLCWLDIANAIHLPPSTFTRLGQGQGISIDTLAALLTWLGETDLAPYLRSQRRRR